MRRIILAVLIAFPALAGAQFFSRPVCNAQGVCRVGLTVNGPNGDAGDKRVLTLQRRMIGTSGSGVEHLTGWSASLAGDDGLVIQKSINDDLVSPDWDNTVHIGAPPWSDASLGDTVKRGSWLALNSWDLGVFNGQLTLQSPADNAAETGGVTSSGALTLNAAGGTLVLQGQSGVIVGAGQAISGSFRGSATVDVASIASHACGTVTITVTGAVVTADVACGPPGAFPSGLSATCYVSATDTVIMRLCNNLSTAVDPPSLVYSARTFNP